MEKPKFLDKYVDSIKEKYENNLEIIKAINNLDNDDYIEEFIKDDVTFSNREFIDIIAIKRRSGYSNINITSEAFEELTFKMKNLNGNTKLDFDNFDEAIFNAEEEAESIRDRIENQIKGTNNIKVESKIEAHRSLSKVRISKLQNDILQSSSQKEIEKKQRDINKEIERTKETIDRLQEKKKLVSSLAMRGLCVLVVK